MRSDCARRANARRVTPPTLPWLAELAERTTGPGMGVVALCATILFVAGCLGPVASLYPPRHSQPATPVWVVDHGWHVGLAVERASLPPGLWPEQEDFADAPYLEIGWGDLEFYRARDPGVRLALRAAVASTGSALHMVGLPAEPAAVFSSRDVAVVVLSQPGFDMLARFVDDSFARDAAVRTPQLGPGLYGRSGFYPARGHYHLFYTCNSWVAEALRAAGVPLTPAYALTAGNLMWQVRRLGR